MRCSESENKLCIVDSVKNRQKTQDCLIKENSGGDVFAKACLRADKRSLIAVFKASVRQKSCIAFNDSQRKWRMVVLDSKGLGKMELCYNRVRSYERSYRKVIPERCLNLLFDRVYRKFIVEL